MKTALRVTILALVLLIGAFAVIHAEDSPANPAIIGVRRSTVETADRMQQAEKNPQKRFQLLLRWIRLKEIFDQNEAMKAPDSKAAFDLSRGQVIARIESELAKFEGQPKADLSILYRELGYRYLDSRLFERSRHMLDQISKRTSDDEIALADALIGSKEIALGLAALDRAARDLRLRPVAQYKRAWAFIQLNRFNDALQEFDALLSENVAVVSDSPRPLAKLKEEAYRDRLRPYVETFNDDHFTALHVEKLKTLAAQVTVKPAEITKFEQDFLKGLIETFNAKAKVPLAEEVFALLSKELKDTDGVLVSSVPLWLKVYRGQLDHESVKRVLLSLPDRDLSASAQAAIVNLQAELHNTALFYETLADSPDVKKLDSAVALQTKNILMLVYAKYFRFFAKDTDSDPLRVNYSKLLLDQNQAVACLGVLENRTRKDVEVEKVAANLQAKCELKELDELYARPHDATFYKKLSNRLLVSKIYLREDLGVSSEQAFQGLAKMLMGALQRNRSVTDLRATLDHVVADYPYSKEQEFFKELQMIRAELNFEDLVASSASGEAKAAAFFKVHSESPINSNVSQKALLNSILVVDNQEALDRCGRYQDVYPENFQPETEIFKRCLGLSEVHLSLERQYQFLKSREAKLPESDQILLGMVELALDKSEGRTRLNHLNTASAQRGLVSWDGPKEGMAIQVSKDFVKLQESTDVFLKKLHPIRFEQIAKIVPKVIDEASYIDVLWVKRSKSSPSSKELAQILYARATLATHMKDWMQALPEPTGLSEIERTDYRSKTVEVIRPFVERAQATQRECGEVAYALDLQFQPQNKALCAESTRADIYNQTLANWHASRQPIPKNSPWSDSNRNELQKKRDHFLEGAIKFSATKDWSKTRYFLLRALDFAETSAEKSHIYVQLARLRQSEPYWQLAYDLDGNNHDAIKHRLEQSTGNPYFDRLYRLQLDLVEHNAAPALPATVVAQSKT